MFDWLKKLFGGKSQPTQPVQQQAPQTMPQKPGMRLQDLLHVLNNVQRPITNVGKSVVKPFWETGDTLRNAGQVGAAWLTNNQTAQRNAISNLTQSANDSVIGSVPRLLEVLATAKAQQNLMNKGVDINAINQTVNQQYNKLIPGLSIGTNASTARRKIGALGGQAAFDVASLGVGSGAAKGLESSLAKRALESGALNSAGSVFGTAQQDNPTARDYFTNAGTNFVVGAGIPVAFEGIARAGKATRPVTDQIAQGNKELFGRDQSGTVAVRNGSYWAPTKGIKHGGGTWGEYDLNKIKEIRGMLQRGEKVDPILVQNIDGQLFVQDGKHRLAAYRQEGYNQIPVTERENILTGQAGFIGRADKNKPKLDLTSDPMQQVFDTNPMNPANQKDLVGFGKGRLENANQKVSGQEGSPKAKLANANDSLANPSLNDTLPVSKTKNVSNLDKVFRSTRSIIERQGENGKKLAGMLQKARDTEEIYQADIARSLPTVFKLKGKEFENFVDATQGNVPAMNDKVASAIHEWQSVHPQIRDRAVQAGLDVGDLGARYYPHFVDFEKVFKDRNTYNEALNHLVQTGQAGDIEQAIKLLGYARDVSRNRKFGNLEASRLVNIPFYDKSKNSLLSYIQGSSRRIAQTETFGKGDENALKLIAAAGQKGYDTEAMKNAYDIAVGAKQYNPTTSKVSKGIRGYLSTTRLGLGAITNASQNVNTGIVTGHMRTLGSMLGQLDPENRKFVEKTGVVADSVLGDLREQTGFIGKTLSKFTAPGFNKVEKFNRSVAAVAGKRYADDLAAKGNVEALRKLGVTGKIGKTLTEDQQIQASRKIVEKTQFKVDPQDLPGWVDSPLGKLVSQFRTFSYSQGKFFSNEVLKPLAKGNVVPLARLAAALPVGYAVYEAKRVINNRPEEDNKTRRGLEAFNSVGGAGLALDMFRSMVPLNNKTLTPERRVSMAVGAFGGPAAGTAAETVGAVSNALPKFFGGASKGEQLGRLGLRQVPIIGTRLQNTFVPYGGKPEPSKTAIDNKEIDSIKKATFGSKEAKAFFKQYPSRDAQLEAARSDPNARALYEKMQAFDRAFSKPDLYSPGLSQESADILTNYKRLSDQARKTTFERPGEEFKYQTAKLENDIKSGKLTEDEQYDATKNYLKYYISKDVPASKREQFLKEPKNDFLLTVMKYNLDKQNGKLTPLDDFQMQTTLAKKQLNSSFSKDVVDMYQMSGAKLRQYLDNNPVNVDTLTQLQKIDEAYRTAGVIKNSKLAYSTGRKRSGLVRGSVRVARVGMPKVSVAKLRAPKASKLSSRRPKKIRFTA